jgi:8-oxo-dGTP pyrophosphatase MutT (NUDIX family)
MAAMLDPLDMGRLRDSLKRQLSWPLPGVEAQLGLSPEPRHGWVPGYVPDDARPGAGLLLLYPKDGQLHTVVTLRNAALEKHAGQLSLPGGAVEAGESLVDAALREAHEEVGLPSSAVEVLGTLTPLYIPVSGFALHPVVGLMERAPVFEPDPGEVERLIEVGLDQLRDDANHDSETRFAGGRRYRVPFVSIGGEKLWGATAMVFAELFAVLDALDPDRSRD